MTTISEKLERLSEIKGAIKSAIEDKGVEVAENASFYSYSESISQIQTGGGNNTAQIQHDNTERDVNSTYTGNGVIQSFITVGNPTINAETGEVSNFSTSNYLKLATAFSPIETDTFEIYLKFKTGATLPDNGILFSSAQGLTNATRYSMRIFIYSSKLSISDSNSSGWLPSSGILNGTTTLTANTNYEAKLVGNGRNRKLYLKVGDNWQEEASLDITGTLSTYTVTLIGAWRGNDQYLPFTGGSIFINDCYINLNGSRWWTGNYQTF